MVVKVFITSVSANSGLKKNQQTIIDTLSAKNIPFELIDISTPENEELKLYMREKATPKSGQAAPMPPQLFVDDEYIGDYDAFYEATEDNNLDVFFKLASAVQSSEATLNMNVSDTADEKPTEKNTGVDEKPTENTGVDEEQTTSTPDDSTNVESISEQEKVEESTPTEE